MIIEKNISNFLYFSIHVTNFLDFRKYKFVKVYVYEKNQNQKYFQVLIIIVIN